jgi:hypothetical protein
VHTISNEPLDDGKFSFQVFSINEIIVHKQTTGREEKKFRKNEMTKTRRILSGIIFDMEIELFIVLFFLILTLILIKCTILA